MTPIRNVLVVGGSGFVGSAMAERLTARDGLRLVIPTRRRERARHLLLLPTAEVVEADVFDPPTLASLMTGMDAVVSLVGVLHSRSGSPYGPDLPVPMWSFPSAWSPLPARPACSASCM
jgi:uncharacterized protein YbjT (DUF2867 family)